MFFYTELMPLLFLTLTRANPMFAPFLVGCQQRQAKQKPEP
jgi:hypothetical protein